VQAIADLRRIGVAALARLDPLIPDLTDTPDNLEPLLLSLHQAGITDIAASYLFLRPAFAHRLVEQMREHLLTTSAMQEWSWQTFAGDRGGGRMPEVRERRERFARLIGLARRHGIEVRVCVCKNPGLSGPGCRIAGESLPRETDGDQAALFV